MDRDLSAKRRLDGYDGALTIPSDRPRTARWTFREQQEELQLESAIADGAEELAACENTSAMAATLTAFQALLHRYTAADDIVTLTSLSLPISKSESSINQMETLVAVRNDFSGDPTFRQALGQVRDALQEANLSREELSFERLNREDTPAFPAMFETRNLSRPTCGFELALTASGSPNGLQCILRYNAELFDARRIRSMLDHYRNLLRAMIADPDQAVSRAPMLGEAEKRRMLVEWNDTGAKYPAA